MATLEEPPVAIDVDKLNKGPPAAGLFGSGAQKAFVGDLMTPEGHRAANEGDLFHHRAACAPLGSLPACASLGAASQSPLLRLRPGGAADGRPHSWSPEAAR
jgi:hypothetical protein